MVFCSLEIIRKNLDFALCIDRSLPQKAMGDSLRFSQIINAISGDFLHLIPVSGAKKGRTKNLRSTLVRTYVWQ